MSPAAAHGKKRKIRRIGRHANPSLLSKVTRRTGKVAPAVAVAGALVATPFIFHLGSSAQLDTAGDVGSAHRVELGHFAGTPTGHHGTGHARAGSRQQLGNAASKHAGTAHPTRQHDHRAAPKTTTRHSASHHPATHPAAPAAPSQSPAPTSSPTSSPTSPTSSPTSKPSSPVCDGTGGLLPENFGAIVTFLTSHGYTGLAAAGIAGNIYRESTGNPESVGTGGGGLIGWTPLPAGFVTGNPTADLQTQLKQLLVYNAQWAQFIPALNAATSAREAAFIYMSDFERPGIPATEIREEAAESVAAACHLS